MSLSTMFALPSDRDYVSEFKDQTNCDLTFVCSDGEFKAHLNILSSNIEYLKSLESFYSNSNVGLNDETRKINLESSTEVARNFVGVFYNQPLEITKISDSGPYLELANYLVSNTFTAFLAKSFSSIIINYIKDQNDRWFSVYNYWLKNTHNYDTLISSKIEAFLRKESHDKSKHIEWCLEAAKLPSQIIIMAKLGLWNYYLNKFTKTTLQLRTLFQIINIHENISNDDLTRGIATLIPFLPIEYWLNVCEYQEGSLGYIADFHQAYFNNSTNLMLRKKIGMNLENMEIPIELNLLEVELLKEDGYLTEDEIKYIKITDDQVIFKLEDKKDQDGKDIEAKPIPSLQLDLIKGTLEESNEPDKLSLEINTVTKPGTSTGATTTWKLTVGDQVTLIDPHLFIYELSPDDKLLKICQNLYGFNNYNYGRTPAKSAKDYIIITLAENKVKLRLKEGKVEIISIVSQIQPANSNNYYSVRRSSLVKFSIPLDHLEKGPILDLVPYLIGIGALEKRSSPTYSTYSYQNSYSTKLSKTTNINFGINHDIIVTFPKNNINVFQLNYVDWYGKYERSSGINGSSVKGLAMTTTDHNQLISLKTSKLIHFRIGSFSVDEQCQELPVRNYKIILNYKTHKTTFKRRHRDSKFLFTTGAYCIYLEAHKKNEKNKKDFGNQWNGYKVYYLNTFKPNKLICREYSTENYYNSVVAIDKYFLKK